MLSCNSKSSLITVSPLIWYQIYHIRLEPSWTFLNQCHENDCRESKQSKHVHEKQTMHLCGLQCDFCQPNLFYSYLRYKLAQMMNRPSFVAAPQPAAMPQVQARDWQWFEDVSSFFFSNWWHPIYITCINLLTWNELCSPSKVNRPASFVAAPMVLSLVTWASPISRAGLWKGAKSAVIYNVSAKDKLDKASFI